MTFLRSAVGSLGFRLAVGFALVAAIAAGGTGAVVAASARTNIYEAEQNRVLSVFSGMVESMPNVISAPDGYPAQASAAANHAADYVGAFLQPKLKGTSSYNLPAIGYWRGNLPEQMMPADFPRIGAESGMSPVPQYLRTQCNGTPCFAMAQAKYIAVQGVPLPESVRPASMQGGVIVVFYSLAYLGAQEQQVNALTQTALWLTLLVGLSAALLGIGLSRQLIKPVHRLRAAVEEFGDTGEPITLKPTGMSELGGVIRSFNRTTDRLHGTLQDLSASEQRARRFVADVSHELRTPTAAMVAAADVLESSLRTRQPNAPASATQASTMQAELSDQQAQATRLTIAAARRLASLTEDLLEISRFDAGQVTVDQRDFDLGERLHLLAEERGWTSPEKGTSTGAAFAIDAAPGLRMVTDPRRLDSVLANLVSNALNHGKPPVWLVAGRSGDRVQIDVINHGPGIAPEDQAKLFDRFFVSDQSRSKGGTGLGLSLAAENIKLLQGTLSVNSTPERTIFTVTLPALPTLLTGPALPPAMPDSALQSESEWEDLGSAGPA
ncbi:sensor histidine kinase [Psychromicrobium xiongbiense]|uniref:sensor histidine kinase n=1 Tax=Psychromicrobium xiongbiense TaxID=3051184 RepID=UPI0025565F26|nr:HAMP domain-containing sensor histidine kinase [Psychromicrobium sp. YIM S02556]